MKCRCPECRISRQDVCGRAGKLGLWTCSHADINMRWHLSQELLYCLRLSVCVVWEATPATSSLIFLISLASAEYSCPSLQGLIPMAWHAAWNKHLPSRTMGHRWRPRYARASLMLLKIKPQKMKTRVQQTNKDEGTWMQQTLRHMPWDTTLIHTYGEPTCPYVLVIVTHP